MKKTIYLLFLLFVICTFSTAVVGQNDHAATVEDIASGEAKAHRHLFAPPPGSNPLTDNYDLKYYRFDWYIDPAFYYIEGSATVYFETLADDFSEIHFDFTSELNIEEIEYHGQNLTFSTTGEYTLTVNLPLQLSAGTLDSMTITYQGAPPSGGFGSFIQSEHNGTPILWTLSEPYGSRDWWPGKNGLDDKIDSMDIIVTTPAAYRAASNGLLVEEASIGSDKVYHWKHSYPITPYLVAIAVTNYTQYTDMVPLSNGTILPMLNYVYPEDQGAAMIGTANLVKVLQYFDSLFVTYPFEAEKYGHAQFGWGGGMEHQTMSFVSNFSWGLLTHELAHMWFGDMVTCGSWVDIWLNEGFATYLEGMSRERFQTPSEWYSWKLGRILNVTSQPGGSVKVDDTTSVGRIFSGRLSYSKGSYLLHMLRWKLGEADFFQGVRNYLYDLQYDFAETPDLQSHLEAASGQDLSEFFQDWYEGEGFPSYQVSWEQQGSTVWIKMDQSTSHPSVDFYEMPVPVLLSGNGQDTLVRLEHEFSGQYFSIELPFVVTSVQFDPELWLLSTNNTVEEVVLNSTSSMKQHAGLRLYPNPADSYLQVEYDGQAPIGATGWQLANAFGQTLKSGTWNGRQTIIPVDDLAPGIYFLKVKQPNGSEAGFSVVKQ